MSGIRVVDGVRSTFRELPWIFDDGGREAAGFTGRTDDCTTRAIAIAMGRDYRDVYDDLFELTREMAASSRAAWARHARKGNNASPRTGTYKAVSRRYFDQAGWVWVPTMKIGSGCQVHLAEGELPPVDRLVAAVSKHLCAVVDGVVRDTHDPTRDGTRCVYGYWREDSIENEVRCRSYEEAIR